jgi:SAM-dependent methyltransferase
MKARWASALAPGVALAGWTAFSLGLLVQLLGRYEVLGESSQLWLGNLLVLALGPLALWVLFALAWRARSVWRPPLLRVLDAHTRALDAISAQRAGPWILLAAGAGLFCELMIIRAHASFFQLFAYYKNVSLLSCFLGLGIGYGLGASLRVATPLVLPGIVLQIALLHSLRLFGVGKLLHNPVSEQAAFGLNRLEGGAQALTVYGFLIAVFAANAMCFVPLGHVASRLMLRIERLRAYGWNLAGSIAGIALFSALSFAWTPPTVWILVLAAALLPLLGRSASLLVSAASVCGLVALLSLSLQPKALDLYSPYQILTLHYGDDGPTSLSVNNAYFQRLLDLRPQAVGRSPLLASWAAYYAIPYRIKPTPAEVLVVGAGAGNDVAAALRNGARHVDAVEIDPAVLAIGRSAHPEAPYDSTRVDAIVDDARSFLRRTSKRYDLIVYGLLDSHTLLASASNVRLDSYVYTVEALREARARLEPDGVLALSFATLGLDIGRKLFLMLSETFDGIAPRVVVSSYDRSMTFLSGPSLPGALPAGMVEVTQQLADPELRADPSTDDWPFLYMPRRTYPSTYVLVIGGLLLVSLALIWQFLPGRGTGFSAPCFFLGAGFMLLETKSITQLALVYGSTWIVVSAVITSILLLGFLANALIARVERPRPSIVYGLLLLSVGACWGLAGLDHGGLPPVASRLLLTLWLTLPLFFAGMAFSTELKTSAAVPAALSANLMGSMLGGFLEYNSMYFGFDALWILALAMYAAAAAGGLARR